MAGASPATTNHGGSQTFRWLVVSGLAPAMLWSAMFPCGYQSAEDQRLYFSDLGFISLILASGFAIYTIVVAVLGAVHNNPSLVASAKRSVLAVAFFLLLASASLIAAFLTHDFGVSYVAQHSSLSMPWYFTAAAFYGGQEGSLLYWALMLSIFSAIFVFASRRAPAVLVPYVMATLMAIETFFLI